MSFARLVLRLATVRALRGQTLAEVRDSEIGAIEEQTLQGETQPFIVVYTDDAETAVTNTDLLENGDKQCIVFEIVVTTRMKNGWGVATTDAGIELTIDAIERQLKLALATSPSPWAEFWRRFATVDSLKSQRGASAKDGVRFAARQVVLDVRLPRDPVPGRPLTGHWDKFLALAADDPSLASQIDMLQGLATGGTIDAAEWQAIMASHGMTRAEIKALGLVPPGETP